MKLSTRNKFDGILRKSANLKWNHLRKNVILVLGRAGSRASTLTGSSTHHGESHLPSKDIPVILDSQAHANCTGNFNVLSSDHNMGAENIVLIAANGQEMGTFMSGSVSLGNFKLNNVYFCPSVGNIIIVSGSMLDNDDYGYEFGRGRCSVTDLRTGRIVGEGRLVNGNYVMDYLMIGHDRTPGLVTSLWNAVCCALHRLGL